MVPQGDATSLFSLHSVEGGELFERIIDEDYHLTEVDCMVFVRQICDGILFMHQMRVLHLDLKVHRHSHPRERGLQCRTKQWESLRSRRCWLHGASPAAGKVLP